MQIFFFVRIGTFVCDIVTVSLLACLHQKEFCGRALLADGHMNLNYGAVFIIFGLIMEVPIIAYGAYLGFYKAPEIKQDMQWRAEAAVAPSALYANPTGAPYEDHTGDGDPDAEGNPNAPDAVEDMTKATSDPPSARIYERVRTI